MPHELNSPRFPCFGPLSPIASLLDPPFEQKSDPLIIFLPAKHVPFDLLRRQLSDEYTRLALGGSGGVEGDTEDGPLGQTMLRGG